MDDDTTLGAVLLGLDGFVLLETALIDNEVWLGVQTTASRIGCHGCGFVAVLHDRRTVHGAGRVYRSV